MLRSPTQVKRWLLIPMRSALSMMLLLTGSLGAVQSASTLAEDLPHRVETQHIANVIQVHSIVLSGGLPSGEEAFRELARLGVRVIISVDGAKPDVATAQQFGLRYIHLPHGYDGIPSKRIAELAKAVRELEGPIYLHCHHGKHRSPAAASVACVSAGLIPDTSALAVLELAGTDPHYRGLYQVVKAATRFSEVELAQIKVDYKEVADVPPLAEAMVELEEAFDRLKELERSGWKTEAERSDFAPASQALLLSELFAEMLRHAERENLTGDYRQFLRESHIAAQSLYESLKKHVPVNTGSQTDSTADWNTMTELQQKVKTMADNCRACHHKFRDR